MGRAKTTQSKKAFQFLGTAMPTLVVPNMSNTFKQEAEKIEVPVICQTNKPVGLEDYMYDLFQKVLPDEIFQNLALKGLVCSQFARYFTDNKKCFTKKR